MTGPQNGHHEPGAAKSLSSRLLIRRGHVVLVDMTFAELIVYRHLSPGAPLLGETDGSLVVEVLPPRD